MDINDIPAENDKEVEFDYRFDECVYSIISCPPESSTPTGSLAFIVYTPSVARDCGVIKIFNLEKGTSKHGFHTSVKMLKMKYIALRDLVIRNKEAKLSWEGNGNLLQYGEIHVKRFTDRLDQFPYFIFN